MRVYCLLALLAMAGSTGVAFATQDASAPPAPVEPVLNPELTAAPQDAAMDADRSALETYVDGVIAAVMARTPIAGMVVSVVRDDRVLLAKGYGQASIEPARPADGDSTMFRIGSISKTFTYTAAMQLVADGKLRLDDPVNQHLPPELAVPDDGYAEPILIRHLLSHTAGFEDSALGHLFRRSPQLVPSPEQYLQQHRPRRVRAPGAEAVYSNYSLALLGAVIAHVSGLPFIDYIEQRVTGPLGMANATFREPLPDGDPRRLDAALAANIATGYARNGGAFEAGPFEFIAHGAAAGGMSATAADMARWMRAHLNDGELDGVRILPTQTSRAMREVMFRNADGVAGIAHGFLTENFGAYDAWGHGGATLYFQSGMVMLPQAGIGVFVSANTANARSAVRDVVRMLVERLLPDARPAVVPVAVDAGMLARYAGTYRSNRRPYSTVEKLVLGATADISVAAADDGSLRIASGEETQRWLPIGAGLFQLAEGNARLQFLNDAAGEPDRYVSGHGVAVNERVGLLERGDVLLGLLALAAVIGVVRMSTGWRRERRSTDPRPGLRGVKLLLRLSALAWIVCVGALVVAAVGMAGEGTDVVFTYPSQALRIALGLCVLVAVLTTIELIALWPVWRGAWRIGPKLRYTIGVLLLALTVGVMCSWNMVAVGT
jgi:CubicO group peptidase (beta-lactamase class C family)